jgi:hypothetical protein
MFLETREELALGGELPSCFPRPTTSALTSWRCRWRGIRLSRHPQEQFFEQVVHRSVLAFRLVEPRPPAHRPPVLESFDALPQHVGRPRFGEDRRNFRHCITRRCGSATEDAPGCTNGFTTRLSPHRGSEASGRSWQRAVNRGLRKQGMTQSGRSDWPSSQPLHSPIVRAGTLYICGARYRRPEPLCRRRYICVSDGKTKEPGQYRRLVKPG